MDCRSLVLIKIAALAALVDSRVCFCSSKISSP